MNAPTLTDRFSTPLRGETQCVVREVMVRNIYGVHVQPAAELVELLRRFQSAVRLVVDGQSYGTDSILDVLSANLTYRKSVLLIAEGIDAGIAASAAERFLTQRSPVEASELERRGSLCGVFPDRPLKRVA